MQRIRIALGFAVVAVIIGLPWAYGMHRYRHFRNFAVVKPGVLYRSGQLTEKGLKRVIHDYGIKTVVTLRDARIDGDEPPDLNEERFCHKNEIRHVRIPPKSWWPRDAIRSDSEPDGFKQFRAVMADPKNHPVLVHCFAGIHRTGTMCAIYRMEEEGWSNEDAMAEMKEFGYFELDKTEDLLEFMKNYKPQKQDD